MLDRVLKVKECLISTLAIVRADLSLSQHDWAIIECAVPILKIFYEVTTEVCGEKYVTLSKVPLYYRIMMDHINKQQLNLLEMTANIPIEIIQLIENLTEGLNGRFKGLETDIAISEATVLDPRLKKKGFKFPHNDDRAVDRLKEKLTALIRRETQNNSVATERPFGPSVSTSIQQRAPSIWDDFDMEIANLVPENPTAAGIRELEKYLQEDYLHRSKDPLEWWEQRKLMYPHIYYFMKKRSCVAATSVPCERIFSKAGQIICEKRSRITSSKVRKLLFLNHNM